MSLFIDLAKKRYREAPKLSKCTFLVIARPAPPAAAISKIRIFFGDLHVASLLVMTRLDHHVASLLVMTRLDHHVASLLVMTQHSAHFFLQGEGKKALRSQGDLACAV